MSVIGNNYIVGGSETGDISTFNVNKDSFEIMSKYKEHQSGITAIDANEQFIISGSVILDSLSILFISIICFYY